MPKRPSAEAADLVTTIETPKSEKPSLFDISRIRQEEARASGTMHSRRTITAKHSSLKRVASQNEISQ